MTATSVVALRDTPGAVVARLAQQPLLWRPHVAFDPERRHYSRFADNEQWEAWLLTWLPGQGTGVHDHGDAAGAFVVLSGRLDERSWSVEERAASPSSQRGPVERVLRPGRVRSFGADLIHEVTNLGDVPAISLHVYQPRLTTMRQYLDGTGRPVGEIRIGADW